MVFFLLAFFIINLGLSVLIDFLDPIVSKIASSVKLRTLFKKISIPEISTYLSKTPHHLPRAFYEHDPTLHIKDQ